MKLNRAFLCLNEDCEEVHNERVCPACGSYVMHPIAKWLNRKPEEVPIEVREIAELERLLRLERRWE